MPRVARVVLLSPHAEPTAPESCRESGLEVRQDAPLAEGLFVTKLGDLAGETRITALCPLSMRADSGPFIAIDPAG
jgi:hypothetical protein